MTLRQSQVLITIREFAKMCRTTPRTLRFYEQKGLFLSDSIDQFTKYRYYDPKRTREFFRIKLLQDFAIPLSDIKTVLFSDTKEGFLQEKMGEIKKQIEEKEKEYEFLKQIRHFLFADENIEKLFKKDFVGPYIMLTKRTTQGRYDKIEEEVTEMISVAKKLHIVLEGTQMTFYLDPVSYKPLDTHLELAIVLKATEIPSVVLPEGYVFRMFTKTKIIAYPYRGPYAYITLVYQKIRNSTIAGITKESRSIDIHLPVESGTSEYEKLTKIAFPIS